MKIGHAFIIIEADDGYTGVHYTILSFYICLKFS